MATGITGTTMASTRTTTRIDLRAFFAAGGFLLVVFAVTALCFGLTPLADQNAVIAKNLMQSDALEKASRQVEQVDLLKKQVENLKQNPAEPFAWARLAYLRFTAERRPRAAFAALKMSDMVSPHEPRQLVERAFMWHDLRQMQGEAERAYQTELWVRAFDEQRGLMIQTAYKRGLIKEVAAAFRTVDEDLYRDWMISEGQKP
jgi:hypothetical protein